MKELKIEYVDEPVLLEKPIHLPIKLSSICPHCGEEVKKDFRQDFFFQDINKPFEYWMSHQGKTSCGKIWKVKMVLKVGLFSVAPGIYEGWNAPDKKLSLIKLLRRKTSMSLLDCKKWVETVPQQVNRELGQLLQEEGGIVHWNY